jgi:hypothetical protein
MIPPARLPALLFAAAATFLVLELEPEPLRSWFPRAGEPQPSLGAGFATEYRTFCLEHRERLLELAARHRYQMNEVGRCAGVILALPDVGERPVALIDVGTGAGLALHLDRYRYVFRSGEEDDAAAVGVASASVSIETELRGRVRPPVPSALPHVVDRVGIDIEPLDVADPAVRDWLAACIPQEAGAVTRFARAVELAIARPARMVRGDACDVLVDVLRSVPADALVCVLDTYVNVFFDRDERRRFVSVIEDAGRLRDLTWVSIDPLVPLGSSATDSVLGIDVRPELIELNRRLGVFGVIGRLSYRRGVRSAELLGIAHPGAAWIEWLAPSPAEAPHVAATTRTTPTTRTTTTTRTTRG